MPSAPGAHTRVPMMDRFAKRLPVDILFRKYFFISNQTFLGVPLASQTLGLRQNEIKNRHYNLPSALGSRVFDSLALFNRFFTLYGWIFLILPHVTTFTLNKFYFITALAIISSYNFLLYTSTYTHSPERIPQTSSPNFLFFFLLIELVSGAPLKPFRTESCPDCSRTR